MLPMSNNLISETVSIAPQTGFFVNKGNFVTPPMALSIRQPWAWLIVNGHKDIENRTWKTPFRGAFLIHTGKMLDEDAGYAVWMAEKLGIVIPPLDELPRGAIIGAAEIVNCVTESKSQWFFGSSLRQIYGFVLCNPVAFPDPIPYKGQQGFFKVEGLR